MRTCECRVARLLEVGGTPSPPPRDFFRLFFGSFESSQGFAFTGVDSERWRLRRIFAASAVATCVQSCGHSLNGIAGRMVAGWTRMPFMRTSSPAHTHPSDLLLRTCDIPRSFPEDAFARDFRDIPSSSGFCKRAQSVSNPCTTARDATVTNKHSGPEAYQISVIVGGWRRNSCTDLCDSCFLTSTRQRQFLNCSSVFCCVHPRGNRYKKMQQLTRLTTSARNDWSASCSSCFLSFVFSMRVAPPKWALSVSTFSFFANKPWSVSWRNTGLLPGDCDSESSGLTIFASLRSKEDAVMGMGGDWQEPRMFGFTEGLIGGS
eukprot:1588789-Rhodomonas_salina.4